ncbi:MAG TPA: hypothetical protein VHM19_09200, partial [Polyangiales bacterium]|nr:hypothetical protein [Polyangiales bacterium]
MCIVIQRRLNVIVLSLSLASATAFAQPRQKDAFIVIPASTSDAMEMQRVMQAAEQSVMQLANSFPVRDAWPLEQTRRRFRQTQSREPAAVSPSELEKLPRQVREALDNYAFGQHALALHQVQGLMERVDRAQ